MTPQDLPAPDDAPGALPGRLRGKRRLGLGLLGLACFTAIVFVGALAVTMPASALRRLVDLPPQVETLSGRALAGRAALSGGYVLAWDASPSGLALGRIAATARLSGADTQVDFTLRASPWAVSMRDVRGRAGPGLLGLLPGLPVEGCTSRAALDVTEATWDGDRAAAVGRVAVAAGACTDEDGRDVPVPAMRLVLGTDGSDATATLLADDGSDARLARLVVAGDRRLLVTVEPAGAALVPGLPASGPIGLEYPF